MMENDGVQSISTEAGTGGTEPSLDHRTLETLPRPGMGYDESCSV